jgi:hypothetical protein
MVLCAAGADGLAQDSNGMTPLYLAVLRRKSATAALLAAVCPEAGQVTLRDPRLREPPAPGLRALLSRAKIEVEAVITAQRSFALWRRQPALLAWWRWQMQS